MHRSMKAGAAGVLLAGFLSTTATAHAAAPVVQHDNAPGLGQGTVQFLDCAGTTGVRGCGGGFFWRDGWRGYGCYPC